MCHKTRLQALYLPRFVIPGNILLTKSLLWQLSISQYDFRWINIPNIFRGLPSPDKLRSLHDKRYIFSSTPIEPAQLPLCKVSEMYGTVSCSPVNQEVHGRNLRLFCSRVCAKVIKVIPLVGYFVLLSWRFVGLLLYSKYTLTSGCYAFSGFRAYTETGNISWVPVMELCGNVFYGGYSNGYSGYSCYDFTPFCFPTKQTVAWLIACIVNTLFVILVLAKVPGYDGHLPTLRKNAKDARFWTLLLQLLLSIANKAVLMIFYMPGILTNNVYSATPGNNVFFTTLFIFEEIFTTLAVYFWNGVPAPWKNPRVPAKHTVYILTLVVFLLEKFYLFLVSSFYTASSAASGGDLSLIFTAISAADATFLYSLTKFFWNKLFYGERNLLINDNI